MKYCCAELGNTVIYDRYMEWNGKDLRLFDEDEKEFYGDIIKFCPFCGQELNKIAKDI